MSWHQAPGSWSFVFPGSVPDAGSVERIGVVVAVSLGASPGRVPSDHHLHLCTQGTWLPPRVGGRWPTLWWRPANLGLAIPSLSLGSSFVNGAGHTRSVTRGHGARAVVTVCTSITRLIANGLQLLRKWYPPPCYHLHVGMASLKRAGGVLARPARPLQPPLNCRHSVSGGHSHGPVVPTQADLLCKALTPGSCQPDWGGGVPPSPQLSGHLLPTSGVGGLFCGH